MGNNIMIELIYKKQIMIQLVYKMINEENSVTMEFDNIQDYSDFLEDVFEINIDLLSDNLVRTENDNIEVMVVKYNDNVILDYMK